MNAPLQTISLPLVRPLGCALLAAMVLLTCLMPLFFVEAMQQALENLHLSPTGAMLAMFGLIFGSAVNLPLLTIPRDSRTPVLLPPGAVLPPAGPAGETLVSVNVGGCLVPLLLAAWLLPMIVAAGPRVVATLLVGCVVNTVVCYRLARIVPNVGIALPWLIPPATAVLVAAMGIPDPALRTTLAPVAYVVGISGPLIGADLLHLRDFSRVGRGMVSIGGAGTWDGIVLAGLAAAFLAGA